MLRSLSTSKKSNLLAIARLQDTCYGEVVWLNTRWGLLVVSQKTENKRTADVPWQYLLSVRAEREVLKGRFIPRPQQCWMPIEGENKYRCLIRLSNGHFNDDWTEWWLNSMQIGHCYTASFDDHWHQWSLTRWSSAEHHRDARGPSITVHWHPRAWWIAKLQTKTKKPTTQMS